MNFKKIIAAIGAAALSLTVIAPQAAVYAEATYTTEKTLYTQVFSDGTLYNIENCQNCWGNQNTEKGVFAPVDGALKVRINSADIIRAALKWNSASTSSDSLVVEFDYKTSYTTADNAGGWFVQLSSGTALTDYKYTIAADVGGKLRYSSDNNAALNQTVADGDEKEVTLPRNSETDTSWHKVKIMLDSVSQETGAFNATYEIDGVSYSKRIAEESDKTCTNLGNTARTYTDKTSGTYTGLYFGVAGKGNTVEFDNLKVTSRVKEGALDSKTGNKVYLDNPLGQWAFNNVKDGDIFNAWCNTNKPGHTSTNKETGVVTHDGPGEGGASMWTGNDTLMLGGQQTKVIKYFDGGAAIPGDKSFIVECEIKQEGGGLFALGLIGDKVKALDNNIYTYAGNKGLGLKLTGMLVGRGSGQGLGAALNNATGISKAYMDAKGENKVMIPDDDTEWHHYKLYVDANETNTLLHTVTLEIDDKLYGSLDSVGTNTDGKWTGVFFANNATGARNTKLAEFKNIKVYEPEIFNIPTEDTFKGTLKFDVDGQEISAKTPVNVKALVTNTAGVTENPYLVAAEYDKNGMLKKIEVKELELSEFESGATEKKYELAVPDTSEKGGKIGAFLWTKDLQPIGEPIYINIAK